MITLTQPVMVPGHPVDNQPTDDFWPHLGPDHQVVFTEDDGRVLGPYRAIAGAFMPQLSEPEPGQEPQPGPSFMMESAEVYVTDRRTVFLGPMGVDAPPDRRMMFQLPHVCVFFFDYEPHMMAPDEIVLATTLCDGGQKMPFSFRFVPEDKQQASEIAVALVRRIGRQVLRLGTFRPDNEWYFYRLANYEQDKPREEITAAMTSYRELEYGTDYSAGGPDVVATLASQHVDYFEE